MPNPIRGDVNVILNRLVREGVIAGFQTSFDDRTTGVASVTVVVGSAVNPEAALSAVRAALDRFAGQVHVTLKAG